MARSRPGGCMTWINDPWFLRGLLCGALVALPCAWIGVFLYLRRLAMVSDALAHTALPGLLVGWLLTGTLTGPGLLLGALASGVATTWLIERAQQVRGVRADAAVGVVFPVLFSLGLIGISTVARGAHLDVDCVLFGNILGVPTASIVGMGATTLAVAAAGLLAWRWLEVASFDAEWARVTGIPTRALHYGLMGAASLTSVASFEAVGAVLGIALLTVPAATAHLVARSLRGMLFWASLTGLVSVAVGLVLSVLLDTAPGGTMVLTSGALYAGVALATRRSHRRLSSSLVAVPAGE
jgi:manganese/zinc/iron transport system permease protein